MGERSEHRLVSPKGLGRPVVHLRLARCPPAIGRDLRPRRGRLEFGRDAERSDAERAQPTETSVANSSPLCPPGISPKGERKAGGPETNREKDLWTKWAGRDTFRVSRPHSRGSVARSNTSDSLPRILIGATVGLVVGYIIGVFVLRWVGGFGSNDGWEDLVALVTSMISFAPVGALIGGALGIRRNGRSLWAAMSTRRRAFTVGTSLLLATAALIFGTVRMEAMSGVFLAVWAVPVGAAIGYLLGRGGRASSIDPPVTPGVGVS